MDSLERHRGHFLNWYDTQSLQPLRPRYVSSVDSGNLAGHLLTLRQGLLALLDQKVVGPSLFAGMADTLAMVVEATEEAGSGELARVKSAVISAAEAPLGTLTAARRSIESIAKTAQSLAERLAAGPENQAKVWAHDPGSALRRCSGRSRVHRPLDFAARGSAQPGRICRSR